LRKIISYSLLYAVSCNIAYAGSGSSQNGTTDNPPNDNIGVNVVQIGSWTSQILDQPDVIGIGSDVIAISDELANSAVEMADAPEFVEENLDYVLFFTVGVGVPVRNQDQLEEIQQVMMSLSTSNEYGGFGQNRAIMNRLVEEALEKNGLRQW